MIHLLRNAIRPVVKRTTWRLDGRWFIRPLALGVLKQHFKFLDGLPSRGRRRDRFPEMRSAPLEFPLPLRSFPLDRQSDGALNDAVIDRPCCARALQAFDIPLQLK
jgi:hypothetical protein